MKTQASSMNIGGKEHSREREQRKAQRRDRMPDLAREQQGHRGWNRGDEGRVVRGQGSGREKEKWGQVTERSRRWEGEGEVGSSHAWPKNSHFK